MLMRLRLFSAAALLFIAAPGFVLAQQAPAPPHDVFPSSTDIGHAQAGSTAYDSATGSYLVRGGDQDIWGNADDFRFTWTRVSGDASLAADVRVEQPATYKFAKGVLMFRQSLDPGAPYADIAIHADGHITLQWRATQGGETKDITLPEHGALRLRIERTGNVFTVYAIEEGQRTANAPSITIPMKDPMYVGLGVCSHDEQNLQAVTFSNVKLEVAQ